MDWPTIDLAVRQIDRYQQEVIAAAARLEQANRNLATWERKLADLKAADA